MTATITLDNSAEKLIFEVKQIPFPEYAQFLTDSPLVGLSVWVVTAGGSYVSQDWQLDPEDAMELIAKLGHALASAHRSKREYLAALGPRKLSNELLVCRKATEEQAAA